MFDWGLYSIDAAARAWPKTIRERVTVPPSSATIFSLFCCDDNPRECVSTVQGALWVVPVTYRGVVIVVLPHRLIRSTTIVPPANILVTSLVPEVELSAEATRAQTTTESAERLKTMAV